MDKLKGKKLVNIYPTRPTQGKIPVLDGARRNEKNIRGRSEPTFPVASPRGNEQQAQWTARVARSSRTRGDSDAAGGVMKPTALSRPPPRSAFVFRHQDSWALLWCGRGAEEDGIRPATRPRAT